MLCIVCNYGYRNGRVEHLNDAPSEADWQGYSYRELRYFPDRYLKSRTGLTCSTYSNVWLSYNDLNIGEEDFDGYDCLNDVAWPCFSVYLANTLLHVIRGHYHIQLRLWIDSIYSECAIAQLYEKMRIHRSLRPFFRSIIRAEIYKRRKDQN